VNVWINGGPCAPPAHLQSGCRRIIEMLQSAGSDRHPRLAEVMWNEPGGFERYAFAIDASIIMQIVRQANRTSDEFFEKAARCAIRAAQKAGEVLDAASVMRHNLESLVGRAQRSGLSVRMHRLDIAEYGQWSHPDGPLFLAGFVTLGDNLRETLEWLVVESNVELERQFAASMYALRDRQTRRMELNLMGADGSIDALALSNLLTQPDPGPVFEQLRRVDSVQLSGGVYLRWTDGRIFSSHVSAGTLRWHDDVLAIAGSAIPETVLIQLRGKPASLVINLSHFDDRMTIREVTNRPVAERSFTEIRLTLPMYLLNTAEHRYWEA
jgi:hypothetical protein